MNKKRDRKSASPHSVAAIASFMVLVVGVGVGAYFVEFRGVGLQAMLSGAQAQELLMLFGGMAACTLLTQFMVAAAAAPSGAQDNVRDMMRVVLELDPNDPDVARKLESVPELHELAMMIAAEKNAKIEALQQTQAQRRDLAGLLKGMERSAVTGDPLREEQGTEISTQIARAWNTLVATKAAMPQDRANASATRPPHMEEPGSPEPGMVILAGAVEAPLAADDVAERVGRVEASLEALQRMVQELSDAPAMPTGFADTMTGKPRPLSPALDVAPSIHASSPLEIETTRAQAHDITRDLELGATTGTGKDDAQTSSPSAYHEWNTAAQEHARSSAASAPEAVEPLAGLEPSGFAPPADLPGLNDELPMANATPEFDLSASEPLATFDTASASPDPATPAPPPGSMSAPGFELADDEASEPAPSFGTQAPDPAVLPSSPTSDVSFGAMPEGPAAVRRAEPDHVDAKPLPELPAEAVDQEFAQHFPHFVGQSVDSNADPVEVTYAQHEAASEAPASSPTPQGAPASEAPPVLPATPHPSRAEQPQASSSAPQSEAAAAGTAAPATPKNPRQFPESQVIDLRSLGAVEFED